MLAEHSAGLWYPQVLSCVYDILVLWFISHQVFSLACQRDKEFVIAENIFVCFVRARKRQTFSCRTRQ